MYGNQFNVDFIVQTHSGVHAITLLFPLGLGILSIAFLFVISSFLFSFSFLCSNFYLSSLPSLFPSLYNFGEGGVL